MKIDRKIYESVISEITFKVMRRILGKDVENIFKRSYRGYENFILDILPVVVKNEITTLIKTRVNQEPMLLGVVSDVPTSIFKGIDLTLIEPNNFKPLVSVIPNDLIDNISDRIYDEIVFIKEVIIPTLKDYKEEVESRILNLSKEPDSPFITIPLDITHVADTLTNKGYLTQYDVSVASDFSKKLLIKTDVLKTMLDKADSAEVNIVIEEMFSESEESAPIIKKLYEDIINEVTYKDYTTEVDVVNMDKLINILNTIPMSVAPVLLMFTTSLTNYLRSEELTDMEAIEFKSYLNRVMAITKNTHNLVLMGKDNIIYTYKFGFANREKLIREFIPNKHIIAYNKKKVNSIFEDNKNITFKHIEGMYLEFLEYPESVELTGEYLLANESKLKDVVVAHTNKLRLLNVTKDKANIVSIYSTLINTIDDGVWRRLSNESKKEVINNVDSYLSNSSLDVITDIEDTSFNIFKYITSSKHSNFVVFTDGVAAGQKVIGSNDTYDYSIIYAIITLLTKYQVSQLTVS